MFGGTCHLLRGNMVCGVYKDPLILRLGSEGAEAAMKDPQVKPFDVTGRPMTGWLMVYVAAVQGDKLDEWIEKAMAFVETLPSKYRSSMPLTPFPSGFTLQTARRDSRRGTR